MSPDRHSAIGPKHIDGRQRALAYILDQLLNGLVDNELVVGGKESAIFSAQRREASLPLLSLGVPTSLSLGIGSGGYGNDDGDRSSVPDTTICKIVKRRNHDAGKYTQKRG